MPGLHPDPTARRGLTLIELLIVVALLVVLATLVVVYVAPSFQDNKNVVRGVDRITVVLLIAKQRTLRDQAPRGVRFIQDPTMIVSQVEYIEQPVAYQQTGSLAKVTQNTNKSPRPASAASYLVTFTSQPTLPVDFIGGGSAADPTDYVVQPGDYFRYEVGSPTNFRIAQVNNANTLKLATPFILPSALTPMYQIVRQTRVMSGESPVALPQNVGIDLGMVNTYSPNNQIPTGIFPTPAGVFEIMFDSGGGVMNFGGSTPIVLYVRDVTAANPLDQNVGRVIGINPRTGMIAASPLVPTPSPPPYPANYNPFAYALDGKSSGM